MSFIFNKFTLALSWRTDKRDEARARKTCLGAVSADHCSYSRVLTGTLQGTLPEFNPLSSPRHRVRLLAILFFVLFYRLNKERWSSFPIHIFGQRECWNKNPDSLVPELML